MSEVRVWFYGDYGCPFSYLADRRLDLLRRERPIEVRWRPLSLYPEAVRRHAAGAGAAGGEEGAGEEGGTGALEGELARAAAELGLPLALPEPTDTREALQAAEFARDVGDAVFARLHAALFRAHQGEGRDIGSRAVLLELAEGAGVDREALDRALDDGRYRGEMVRAREEAERYGIEATPGLLFGRFLVVGAAPLSELRRAAERAETEPETPVREC